MGFTNINFACFIIKFYNKIKKKPNKFYNIFLSSTIYSFNKKEFIFFKSNFIFIKIFFHFLKILLIFLIKKNAKICQTNYTKSTQEITEKIQEDAESVKIEEVLSENMK
jgi:hypothetical protein